MRHRPSRRPQEEDPGERGREGDAGRSRRRLPTYARRAAVPRWRSTRTPTPTRSAPPPGCCDLFAQLGVEAAPARGRGGVAAPRGVPAAVRQCRRAGSPTPGRSLYALDCGSRARVALALDGWEGFVVNIDHHRDNSGFGDLILLRTGGEQHLRDGLRARPCTGARAWSVGRDGSLRGHLIRLGSLPPLEHQARRPSRAPPGSGVSASTSRLSTSASTSSVRARPFVCGRAPWHPPNRRRTAGSMLATVTPRDYAATGAREEDDRGHRRDAARCRRRRGRGAREGADARGLACA